MENNIGIVTGTGDADLAPGVITALEARIAELEAALISRDTRIAALQEDVIILGCRWAEATRGK